MGVRRPVKKETGGKTAGSRPTAADRPAAAAKAADAAARRRVAATLDLDALAATLPDTAGATARHWQTPTGRDEGVPVPYECGATLLSPGDIVRVEGPSLPC